MAKLSKIATAKVEVNIPAGTVQVRGLSMSNIAELLQDYPDLLHAITGKSAMDMAAIIARIPGAVSKILSMTCSESMDAEDVSNVGITDSLDLIIGVIEATFPGGITPFLKKIEGLAKVLEQKV